MRLLKFIPFTAFVILIFCFGKVFAQYENQSYLPLTAAEMKNTFPITYVGTLGNTRAGYFEKMREMPLPKKVTAGVSDVFVSEGDDDFTLTGKDKNQKSWSVKLDSSYWSGSVRFYVSDLDKNGIKDLILWIPTGGNGLAPTSHFLSLTFDSTGRPFPFRAEGYFEDRNGKLFDLVDIDNDGRAELLYMNYDDGYWITNFYKIQNARWQKVKGKLGSRAYPLYTRFTYRENHKPAIPLKGKNPTAPDLSNTTAKLKGRLLSYDWANVNQSEDITLHIVDENGRKFSASPVSWYSSFFAVIDNESERKIVSLSTEDNMKAVLNEIISKNYSIEIYGERMDDSRNDQNSVNFRPELLWAKER